MTGKKNVRPADSQELPAAKSGKVYRCNNLLDNSSQFSSDSVSLKESEGEGDQGQTPVLSYEQGGDAGSFEVIANSPTKTKNFVQRTTSCDRSNLALDISGTGTAGGSRRGRGAKLPSSESLDMEEDWVLLDCCFGIPLFDANANRQICRRIASQKLCNKERCVKYLHSTMETTFAILRFTLFQCIKLR